MRLESKKNALAMALFVVSIFILGLKLLLPTTIQIFIQGQSTYLKQIPNLYTLTDVALIVISSSLLTASAMYLLLPTSISQTSESEKKRIREATLKTLKSDERKIYQLLIDSDGVMFQSEVVKESGLPKSTVSLTLDRLEARGFVERRRRGMSNVVILKQ